MKMFNRFFILIWSVACLFIFINTAAMAEEKPVHKGYPLVFDITGHLYRISEKQLVMGDDLFVLSPSTSYHTPITNLASFSTFNKNDFIGIILKDKKGYKVRSVWLIKEATTN